MSKRPGVAVVGVEHPVLDRAQLAVVGVDQREQFEVARAADVEHEILQLATGGLQPFGHVDPLQLVGLAAKLLLLVSPVARDVLGRPLEPVLALLDTRADVTHGVPFRAAFRYELAYATNPSNSRSKNRQNESRT